MEGKDAPAARVGIALVGEEGLHAGGLVEKGQRVVPGVSLQPGRQAVAVLRRLGLDAAEGRAHRLGLDHADGASIDEEHIVREAGLKGKLRHGHTVGGAQVDLFTWLHRPSGGLEMLINMLSGFLLGFQQDVPCADLTAE